MVTWLAIRTFLGRIPAWAYVALAAVAIVLFAYHKGGSDKDAEWRDRLAKAEAAAKLEAEKAINAADEQAEERALAHAASQAELRKLIDEAEDTGVNPLDQLVSGLRP